MKRGPFRRRDPYEWVALFILLWFCLLLGTGIGTILELLLGQAEVPWANVMMATGYLGAAAFFVYGVIVASRGR